MQRLLSQPCFALSTKAAQFPMALRHHERNFATRSAHYTRSKHVTRYHQSSCSPATCRVYITLFPAPQWRGTAPRERTFHQGRANQWHSDITNVVSPHGLPTHALYETSSKNHASSLQDEHFLPKSHAKSPKRAFRTRLPQKLICHGLQNESLVRDFHAETPIGAHASRSPAKQFRDSIPSNQHPLVRQSQCHSDIHLYHMCNSQPHDSLRLPRVFPRPRV